MDVVSACPLRVASIVWQPRAGAWALTLVVKATFRLEPGLCPLVEPQEDPAGDDDHWDDDSSRSLSAASDLVPFKARADVLLVGHAFAPGQAPVRALVARLAVAELDKSVEVWCDRMFWQGRQLLEGPPFARMPLRYERAAWGKANPVGMRFDAPIDAQGTVAIPNLQPSGLQVTRPGQTFAPTAFGPVAPSWPERAGKLGRHAAAWSPSGWREQPLPEGLDPAYFNAAPRDQQVESIPADARLLLENLHPEHARLETRLPGIRPSARMTGGGRAGEGIALVADTLVVDTDRGVVTVVWRGRVPLMAPGEAGQVVVSMEGAAAGDAHPGTVLFRGGEEEVAGTMVLGLAGGGGGGGMPFVELAAEMGTMLGGRPAAAALPFAAAKSPWLVFGAEPGAKAEPVEAADTGTLYGVKGKAHGALPSSWVAPVVNPSAPRVAEVEVVEAVEVEDEETPPAAEVAPVLEPEAASAEVMLPLAEFPIERCAAITASMARRKAETARILEENDLNPEVWAALGGHWSEAIGEETRRGKTGLLRAFDSAYVGRIEEERGPILVEEYARLVVASERGTLTEALAALSLPKGAMMRIERTWLGKIAADARLGKIVRAAMTAAREA